MDEAGRWLAPKYYDLENEYLLPEEKQEVELWFQFPDHCAVLAFLICAIVSAFYPLSWKVLLLVPMAVDLVVAFIIWFVYNRRLLFLAYVFLLHQWILWLIALVAMAILIAHHLFILAIITFIVRLIGAVLYLLVHMPLYSILVRPQRMHPKYAFFKRFYNMTFPFESPEEA